MLPSARGPAGTEEPGVSPEGEPLGPEAPQGPGPAADSGVVDLVEKRRAVCPPGENRVEYRLDAGRETA